MKNKYTKLRYINVDNNLKKYKIKYIVFGILNIIFPLTMLIIESVNGHSVSSRLDNFLSVILIFDIVIGALLLLKGILLRKSIPACNIYNIENTILKNDNRVTLFPIFRLAIFLSLILNAVVIGYACANIYYSFKGTQVDIIIQLVLSIIYLLITIVTNMYMDKETKIYKEISTNVVENNL